MFHSQRFKPFLLYRKSLSRTLPLQIRQPNNPFPSILSLKHSSNASQQHSFVVSYLVNNREFSPETALKASKFIQFETSEKPDSVIAFFRDNGFSNTQINSIVGRAPKVLTCDPHKRVFPKFEFLLSKGASRSDIVELVSRSPRILYCSLENNIVPSYELMRKFFQTDKETMDCIRSCSHFFGTDRVVKNVKLLVDDGVTDRVLAFVLRRRISIILCSSLKRTLDEVKEMGFDPSKLSFAIALVAKTTIPKSRWERKVDAFKRWGWSEELVLRVFRKQPLVMLVSQDKIDRIMRFWVKQLGWDYLALTKKPEIFGFSLERRIIPRALVVQYLLKKSLRSKSASLITPFSVSDKVFIENYVMRFKEETSELLKLYQFKE
ncbi:hypothetical protein V8G54_007671 [Vigna mungo]|uniref:Uncharacterized protein n=1 Tax=Vigna mungo TaxID=3915 RepID=A0AAQ3S5N5_VIGMU